MKPVQILYHGTCKKYSNNIEQSGLIPVNYNKVYLTADVQVAYEYATTCAENNSSIPIVCIVDAKQMAKDGLAFEHDHEYAEWTVDSVPTNYLLQIIIESENDLDELAHYAQEIVNSFS